MKLSANLGFLWPELPLLDRIAAAGRAGFKAVELHWPYDIPAAEVRAAADAAGVVILGLNSPRGDFEGKGEIGLACLPGREEDFAASVEEAAAYARVLGAQSIHVMAGRPGDIDPAVWQPLLAVNMARAADIAGDFTVLMEALNTGDNPGYAYARIDEADAIRQRAGRDNLRLMFDAYHEATGGGDLVEVWRRLRPVIGHIQIAGVPGRAEPDLTAAPLAALMQAMGADGFTGWIGAEYRPVGETEAGLGWREDVPAAL